MNPLEIDKHFSHVADQVDLRWHLLVDHSFPLFSFSRKEEEITREFYHLHEKRRRLWQNPLFELSLVHAKTGRYRHKECITFSHSATTPSYNCTSIQVGGRKFFALEGPLEKHVSDFLKLMSKWRVSHLVCLTDESDLLGNPKCFPYWRGRRIKKEGLSFLSLPEKEIPYYFWPEWEDNQGVAAPDLIKAASFVRATSPPQEIIAVHCSAGVGRTGTFIAALMLMEELDALLAQNISPDKVEISIAKLFFYLNLYRPLLVAEPVQYLTLYKTVEKYLKTTA